MNFKATLKICGAGLFVMACQPRYDVIPLPETEFRTIANFEIARDISQNCSSLALNKSRAEIDLEVDAIMRTNGLTQAEINKQKHAAAINWEPKYKEAYANVLPIDRNDPDYYCKYGEYEISRRSAIGLLLS